MSEVTVYGASDDLIEVDGAIREEFVYGDDLNYLAFSDGTVLSIVYGPRGTWRISHEGRGSAEVEIVPAPPDDEDVYSDKATLTGDLRWVVRGTEFVRAKGTP